MGQSAILSTPFRGPSGFKVVAAANEQGLPLAPLALRPGNVWYVDETLGDDAQDNAGWPYSPFATLGAALTAASAGDTICITGTVHLSATLHITKSNIAIVGLNAPSMNNRARISQTGSTVFSPLVQVDAGVYGCRFENFGTFHGFANASTQVCRADLGGRNYYKNVDFFGMGHATAAAQAGSRSLLISGSDGEHLFEGCRIGLDTITRATNANASLEFTGGSPRNKFVDCVFSSLCSLAGDTHVTIGAGGIDRWAIFDRCQFVNATSSGGTALTAAFSVNASAGGFVVVAPTCISVGATKISAAGPVYVGGAVPTAGTSNLAVAAS